MILFLAARADDVCFLTNCPGASLIVPPAQRHGAQHVPRRGAVHDVHREEGAPGFVLRAWQGVEKSVELGDGIELLAVHLASRFRAPELPGEQRDPVRVQPRLNPDRVNPRIKQPQCVRFVAVLGVEYPARADATALLLGGGTRRRICGGPNPQVPKSTNPKVPKSHGVRIARPHARSNGTANRDTTRQGAHHGSDTCGGHGDPTRTRNSPRVVEVMREVPIGRVKKRPRG